ncbi:L-lysine 6-monooxygenase (NADPH) [Cellulomonas flavigena DSM 20109]|uniref:L-lysine N6-monooxygenase MbtG n=1 Tax=Cellulomonas flavigena (strain ATCC 482 / DSM 20109 / BCRC 11376 / JCM 18109 / NBRC 3775 / NCIMB 8073 / NRS 134) TaxID=446466 RepID=D5UDN7_CELFN|nr:SidA/IucD/PvdA family monooxygenase [Cellulomonas flavigena]ADG76493.1 L-lysine 6-monooxygenase (NADPH) [Cellulomonas flavigena DSM 20109]
MTEQHVDVLMIGAGPANLALAIALEECGDVDLARSSLILEQFPDVKWQRNLLLPWARSQVSFLKDLVTLRNPQSRFSFLNYLRQQGQLDEFVNLATFNPYRWQLSAYQEWVAEQLAHVGIRFNSRVEQITPRHGDGGDVVGWVARLSDGTSISCRDLVVGIGRAPRVPEAFAGLPADRVVHSTQYGTRMKQLSADQRPERPVVIGGAQSAAEMFMALHQDAPTSRPTLIHRSIGLQNYQTSKFVNELFFPSFVDEFFHMPADARRHVLDEMHPTNYAALAPPLLDEIYSMLYQQRMTGQQRSTVRSLTEVETAHMDGPDVVLDLRDRKTGGVEQLRCDMVFLGTGYDPRMPPIITDIARRLDRPDVEVSRQYRMDLGRPTHGAVYLQGVNEQTHGIADSLISVLAHRSQEITSDLLGRRVGLGRDPFPAPDFALTSAAHAVAAEV